MNVIINIIIIYYILIINKLYIENALILYISNYKKNVIYSCTSLACKMLF